MPNCFRTSVAPVDSSSNIAARRCNGSTRLWCNSFIKSVAAWKVWTSAGATGISVEPGTRSAFGGTTWSTLAKIADAASAEKKGWAGPSSSCPMRTTLGIILANSPWSSRTTAPRRGAASIAAAPLLPASLRARKITRLARSENLSNKDAPPSLRTTRPACSRLVYSSHEGAPHGSREPASTRAAGIGSARVPRPGVVY